MPRQQRFHPYARHNHHQIQTSPPSAPPLSSPRYPHPPTLTLPRSLALPAISEHASIQSSAYQCPYPSYIRRRAANNTQTRAGTTALRGQERALHMQMATEAAAGVSVVSQGGRRLGYDRGFEKETWARDTTRGENGDAVHTNTLQLQHVNFPRSTTPFSQASDSSSESYVDENTGAVEVPEVEDDAVGEDEEEYRLFLVAMEQKSAVLSFLGGRRDG